MTTTVQVRMEKKLKEQAQKTLATMGLDLSSGIKIFLTQVVKDKEMPFTPSNNAKIGGLTREQMDKEVEYALRHGKRYASAGEMFKDMSKE